MTEEIAANWARVVLVCGTCSKRVGGGWGTKGRTSLFKALRRQLGVSKGPQASVGVVETGCLGACPPRGVVLLDAARPGRWVVARPGESAAAVLAALEPTETASEVLPSPAPAPAPASLADWRAVLRRGADA